MQKVSQSTRHGKRWLLLIALLFGMTFAYGFVGVAHLFSSPAQDAVVVSVVPAETTVVAGQEFTLSLQVATGEQEIDTVDLHLEFDSTSLEVLEMTPQTEQLPTVLDSSYDNDNGRIAYTAGIELGGSNVSGTFTVVQVRFRANQQAPDGTTLRYVFEPPVRETNVYLGGESVLDSTEDGAIIIHQPSIEGWVYVDENQNGVRDPGEPGLAGQTVELWTNSVLLRSTQTGVNGWYGFRAEAGVYTVRLVEPDGYEATSPTSLTVLLGPGERKIDNNFGLYPVEVPEPTATPTPTSTPVVEETPTPTPTATSTPEPAPERTFYFPVAGTE